MTPRQSHFRSGSSPFLPFDLSIFYFCGIIGTSKNPKEKLDLFEKNDAILVLDSINLLPKVLNLE